MKTSVIISFAYIAAVIGAGFASGAEIVSFFLKYGKGGILGVFLSGVLFGVFAYFILKRCVENNISDFDEYLKSIMPPVSVKITNIVVVVFMVVCLAAMASAAGEILYGLFYIPEFIGTVLFSFVTSVLLMLPVSGITKINGVLGIIISIGIIASCIYIINFRFTEVYKPQINWVVSAVTYTAYNGISAGVVLCSMSRFLKTKRQVFETAFFSGAGIFLILAFLMCVIGIYYGKVDLGEIPMLAIVKRQGKWLYLLYSMVLFLAVFTTALSNGFGILEYTKNLFAAKGAVFCIAVLMITISMLGFGKIVDVVYRICGYGSLILPLFIVINEIKERKTKKKRVKQ